MCFIGTWRTIIDQWFSNQGPQMFLDCNSQKSWLAQQVVKASGNCSPRTSGDPSLKTTVIDHVRLFIPIISLPLCALIDPMVSDTEWLSHHLPLAASSILSLPTGPAICIHQGFCLWLMYSSSGWQKNLRLNLPGAYSHKFLLPTWHQLSLKSPGHVNLQTSSKIHRQMLCLQNPSSVR